MRDFVAASELIKPSTVNVTRSHKFNVGRGHNRSCMSAWMNAERVVFQKKTDPAATNKCRSEFHNQFP